MRVLIQRVKGASVEVDEKIVGKIGVGVLAFLGITHTDTEKEAEWLAEKLVHLRIFEDPSGKMNQSLTDVSGACLIISQFTLYGDVSAGRRPSFIQAADPEMAKQLYKSFIAKVKGKGVPVESGIFGADMQVSLINDGPVTLLIDR